MHYTGPYVIFLKHLFSASCGNKKGRKFAQNSVTFNDRENKDFHAESNDKVA